MKLSVIIPCYNAQRYLTDCVHSVLAQSMKDFEILLIDDGSGDGTLALAKRLAQEDARVRVYHQENAGVCAARNIGLEKAAGEWIVFVDSDDLLPERAFELLLAEARPGIDMVVGAHETFDANGRGEQFRPEGEWHRRTGERQRSAAAKRLIEGDSILNIMCNKLHRKSLLEREGIRLMLGLKIAEDALFNLEAVLCGDGIAYVDAVTYRYRMHDQSAMHRNTAGAFDTHEPWFCAMAQMLSRRGVMKPYFSAWFDSVVLRLYKDGGIGGVVRGFAKKAEPLILAHAPSKEGLDAGAFMRLWLARRGLYAAAYPLIVPFQIVGRKLRSCADMLRGKKGRQA